MRLTRSLIVRLSFALVVAAVLVPAVPDVDLWGHTTFGGDIVRSGAIPVADTYSFTSDLPWVNHEWLSEVAMYGAYAAAGGAGLVALRVILLAMLLAAVWRTLARDGVSGEATLVLIMVLALVTLPRTQHVRPQVFSLVMFALLLFTLREFDRTRRLALLGAVPLLMLVWANLHGGFIVGLLPLGVWAAAYAVDSGASPRLRAAPSLALLGAVAATLANPYGVGLWKFLWRTVGVGRADVDEWWPILSASGPVIALWLTTAAIALGSVALQKRPRDLRSVVVLLAFGLASFRVTRLDAFFAVATVMCIGPTLSLVLARRARTDGIQPSRVFATATVVAAMCVAALVIVPARPRPDGCVDRATWLPEQDATEFIMRNHLRGRMVVFFNWGEYTLWQFRDRLTVSTDGRRETVYSDADINGHLAFYEGTPAGLQYFRRLKADYVWLPTQSPSLEKLQSEGWIRIYSGDRSVILARPAMVPAGGFDMPAAQCYPGRGYQERSSPLSSGLWRMS